MNLGAGFFDLGDRYADEYSGKHWACFACTKPRRILRYPASRGLPDVFECPVDRFAPFAASHNCKDFEAIPGYSELWDGT